ncbi:MAG: RHS repeat-associated core domain-containing protein [Fimbriimonas sp.]
MPKSEVLCDSVKSCKAHFSNSLGTAWDVEGTEVYGYEAERDFLTSADYDGSGPGAPDTWTYDAAHNRSNSLYTYDALDRMTTSPGYGYTHDAVGNRLSKGGTAWTYTWDALNRMLTHTKSGQPTATYAYRADGMRVGKTYGTATTLYRHDGQMSMQEVEATSGTVTAVTDNALGARGVDAISRTTSSGTAVRYPLYDAHGSSIGTVASTGPTSLGDQRSYDAWGGVRAGATTGAPSGRYVANLGHIQDDESGFVYMRARYYEPGVGRFLSEDTAMAGINWYTYCSNDPVNMVDETGMQEDTYQSISRWWGPATAIATIIATCALSSVARLKGLTDTGFLIVWWLGDLHDAVNASCGDGDTRIIGGLLIHAMTTVVAGAMSWEGIKNAVTTSSLPGLHAVAFILEHMAFIGLFMELENVAAGG